jgi:peptidoglycan/xylan/chitin deacetylase (PgdA/CDA1 family)
MGVRGRARPLPSLIAAAAVAALSLLGDATATAAVKKGSIGPDLLMGTPRADTIGGLAGNDSLYGRPGADKLIGGPGDDRLRGDEGQDKLSGGAGDDLLLAKDGAADGVDCGPGTGDIAVVDPVDLVLAGCEQTVGRIEEEPTGAVAGPPAPSTSPVPSAPSELAPPEEPAKEPPGGGFEERPLAMFPEGHGWTGNGEGTFSDVGPPFVVNDDRSFRITTDGNGDESIATSPPLDPVDLTGSHVSVQAQIGFGSRLDAVKLRLSSGNIATDYAEATVWESDFDPIILRSSFEFQSLPVKGFHVVGDVDWSKIDRAQLIVTDNEAGPVFLYVAGIYAVPTSHQATVSFTFDDGYESVFKRGMSKLSAYRYPASAYVIADVVGDAGMLNLEQLYTLRDLHHWEIAGHAFSLVDHNLSNGLDGLEPEALKEEMNDLRDWLDENGFSRASFAYPKGAAGPEVRHYAKRDYCAGRSTAQGPETIPPRDNYTVRGWSVNGLNTDVAEIDAAIDEAVAEGTWLVLTFHNLVGGTPGVSTEFNDDDFGEVVDHVRELQKEDGLVVRTVGSAIGSC